MGKCHFLVVFSVPVYSQDSQVFHSSLSCESTLKNGKLMPDELKDLEIAQSAGSLVYLEVVPS